MLLAIIAMLFTLSACDHPPAPPLKLYTRPSKLDSTGLVLCMTNTSDKSLSCLLTARNTTLNQTRTHPFDIGPNATTEIGILEMGWSFKTGEKIRLAVEGFETEDYLVP